MSDSTSKTWFITGASTGFGEALATYALEQGDRVAATFRKDGQASEFSGHGSGRALGVVCDVTEEQQVKAAIEAAIAHFGYLDVVVNNAGYGSMGSIEEVSAEEVRRQFDVNVFGPLHVLRAVLPHLRSRRAGHILNITSIGGLRAFPGVGIYNGSKFALEGIGESLSLQLAPLGIRVTNVEPSGFRTKWAGESATFTEPEIDDYQATVGENMRAIQGYSGRQPGDPVRAAKAMFELVRMENPPLHLPLGVAAVRGARDKVATLARELEQYAHIGEAADFPAGE
ncbi:oxidoreductase [Hymenobacter saemangeumensis]|uniref:Oxidoreductase n=1 Tax=Hymenobacter saemangeumensis TaxID=1084522 RepID=A0ABP8IS75_9BACT